MSMEDLVLGRFIKPHGASEDVILTQSALDAQVVNGTWIDHVSGTVTVVKDGDTTRMTIAQYRASLTHHPS